MLEDASFRMSYLGDRWCQWLFCCQNLKYVCFFLILYLFTYPLDSWINKPFITSKTIISLVNTYLVPVYIIVLLDGGGHTARCCARVQSWVNSDGIKRLDSWGGVGWVNKAQWLSGATSWYMPRNEERKNLWAPVNLAIYNSSSLFNSIGRKECCARPWWNRYRPAHEWEGIWLSLTQL